MTPQTSSPWKIDVVSTARADFAFTGPVAQAIDDHPKLSARLIFTGSHFSANEYPHLAALRTAQRVETAEVQCRDIGGSVRESADALGSMTGGFASIWDQSPPDLCLLAGDRYELLAPASVAVLYRLPVAHLFGGEEDIAYCFDTQIRNAVTRIAHVHFVMHEAVGERLLAMGEEPWRVHVAGNPALDRSPGNPDLFKVFACDHDLGSGPFIAACYLPPTTMLDEWPRELEALFASLDDRRGHQVVWAGVNSDPGSPEIEARIRHHCDQKANHHYFSHLGAPLYHSLLQCADCLVGNSSSGLLEAASYGLPVVNIGIRQTGRLGGDNVRNVPALPDPIRSALGEALDDRQYRQKVSAMTNPFARRNAGERVADGIASALDGNRLDLMLKRTVEGNPTRVGGLQRVPEYRGAA